MSIRDKAYSSLIRELWGSPDVWNARRSYVEIAARLGVDEETVRNRIRNLRSSGYLLGYRLLPNASLLGRASASLRIEFENRESKQNAIPRLAKMEGVINVVSAYDNSVIVTLLASPEQNFPESFAGMVVEGDVSVIPGLRLRTSNFRMTRLDWEIVSHLLKNAETRLDFIAKKTGVSTRTVKRRLNMMMQEAAIFAMPIVDLGKAEGISYQLRVETEPDQRLEIEKSVASRIGDIIFRANDSRSGLIFGFAAANIAQGNDILEWVKQQPGVRFASLTMVERIVQAFDWIQREVETRMKTR